MPYLFKKLIIILFILVSVSFAYSSILVKQSEPAFIPPYRFFNANKEFVVSLHDKKITPQEYVTDPLILYASLWGCLGTTLNLWWETPSESFNQNSSNFSGSVFANRMKMEPFATGRIDSITKVVDGRIILKNDFYAKNLIEPFFFIQSALYLRSKNYHPAIMIAEVFTLSLLYEFTVKPFFINSSFEQLLKNPGAGIIFGILLDEISSYLMTTPYMGLHVLAYILNPFNALPTSRVHPLLFFDPYKKAASLETLIKL
jgi:hypothetical protein